MRSPCRRNSAESASSSNAPKRRRGTRGLSLLSEHSLNAHGAPNVGGRRTRPLYARPPGLQVTLTPLETSQPGHTTEALLEDLIMRLTIGSVAPDFSAESIGGRRVSLDQLHGRPLLLKFYRFATCPICNLHMHRFIEEYALVASAGLTTVV